MNYEFPIINNIEDVLPHIKDFEEIVVSENTQGNFVNIRYMVSTPQLWERTPGWEIRRECRGLIFDSTTGKILARPWHKFFNIGEKPETQPEKINLYEPHVILEKLDGSCIFAFKLNEELKIATKAGETDVSAMTYDFLQENKHYYDFMNWVIEFNSTPLFEFCSRKNRIVIDYPEDRLVLTGIRENHSGKYWSYDELVCFAQKFRVDYVRAINTLSVQNIHLLVNQVKEWKGSEGIVMRFDDGHILKVKADDYIQKHYAKEAINHEKNLIALILNDGLDDLIPTLYEEDRERVLSFETDFYAAIHDTCMEIHDMYGEYVGDGSQKDFAVNFVSQKDKKYHQFLYKIHRGDYNLMEALYSYIKKNLSTSTKVDEVRWIFGNIRWS